MSTRFAAPGPEQADRVAFERVMGSRRVWRRIARRAAAAHQRELGELARQVAATAPPVLAATSLPLRGWAHAAVVTLTLSLPGWELHLSGVAAIAAADLAGRTQSQAERRLTRTGRYGGFWWIEIESGDAVTVLLGSQLRLFPTGDGTGLTAPQMPQLDLPLGR